MKHNIPQTYVVSAMAHSFEQARDKRGSRQRPEHVYEHNYASHQTTPQWLFS